MTLLTIQLTITLESALSIGAGGSAGTIADKSIVRDGWGRPMIPGSQVKGKLRWAAEQLLRGMGQDIPAPFDAEIEDKQTLVRELFGSPQHRSPLHFADLPATVVAAEQAPTMQRQLSQIRPSVSINRRRGVAEDQRLLFQEITLEGMIFHSASAIRGNLDKLPTPAEHYAALLWAALKLTTRWGGAKSRGLGWATIDCAICLDGQKMPEPELANALCDVLAAPGGGQ